MKQMESQTQLAVAKQQGVNAEKTTKLAGENALRVAKHKERMAKTQKRVKGAA